MDSDRLTARWLVSATLVIFSPVDVPVIAQQKQPTAIEQMAAALESALKTLAGRDQKPARPAAPVAAVELRELVAPVVARPEADVEQRLQRLESHAIVLQDWIDLHVELSEKQRQHLSAAASAVIAQSQGRWKAGDGGNTSALDDFFPINFTDVDGPARELDQAAFTVLTTDRFVSSDQAAIVLRATSEREDFYRDAALGYVLNLLDDVFFLTPEQRKQISEILSKVSLNGACFSIGSTLRNQYFRTVSVAGVVASGRLNSVLSPNQRLMTGTGDGTLGYILPDHLVIRRGDATETQQETLKTSAATQSQRLNQNLAVRIDFYQSTCGLSDKQARHLQLAGKGALDDVIRTWKANTTKTMERSKIHQQRFAGQNVPIAIPTASLEQLLSNTLWTQTVESMVSADSEAIKHRDKARQEAQAKFAVALLDRELWLEPFQRERLLKSVEKTLPSVDDVNNYQQNVEELSLLCVPLLKLSRLDLTILSPAQRTVWNGMKEHFTLNGDYVQVQMKRHRTLSIRLPE